MKELLRQVKATGLSDKAARIYIAALDKGETTVQSLAQASEIKRTTIYYILNELLDTGALIEVKRRKKVYYIADLLENFLRRARERLTYPDGKIEVDLTTTHSPSHKPRIHFLYGPNGFKQIWNKVFSSKSREYCIVTDGSGFLDFVKEKYIINEIISMKRKKGISSKQIIVDSTYARSIVAKDGKENRTSKFLPRHHKLPFTEVISETFVAFISPRTDNTLFVIENEEFVLTRKHLFEALWESLPA
jgi:HTH-type transcriptional regulator, sugar sensing transcriptional regulator